MLTDSETGQTLWRSRRDGPVQELEWSSDGRRLAARRARATDDVAVYTGRGALFTGFRVPRGSVSAMATAPDSHARAVAIRTASGSRLLLPGVRGPAISSPGAFDDLAWSPDGRWLVVGWPVADQWVFVRVDGKRIRAVSNVSRQFRSQSFPRIEGWCCR